MAQPRSNLFCLLVLLAAVVSFGASHRALAGAHAASGPEDRPCCDGRDQAAMDRPTVHHSFHGHFDCAMAHGAFHGCTSAGHCTCSQPVRAVQMTAREIRPALLAPAPLLLSPGPPIAAGRIPPPQGPPDTGFADPPGRHTYLATLRLRI